MLMTVETLYEWLTEKRMEVAEKDEYFGLYSLVIPPFICDDGTQISIQASRFHYCDKKQDANDGKAYTMIEASTYITFEISMHPQKVRTEDLSKIYKNCMKDCVIGHVPIDLIVAEINAHQDINVY